MQNNICPFNWWFCSEIAFVFFFGNNYIENLEPSGFSNPNSDEIIKGLWSCLQNLYWRILKTSNPPSICILIFGILQFEISSLMNLIFSLFQTWILQATAGSSNLKKNPVHQTWYFKLENWKNPVQIDKGEVSHKLWLICIEKKQ